MPLYVNVSFIVKQVNLSNNLHTNQNNDGCAVASVLGRVINSISTVSSVSFFQFYIFIYSFVLPYCLFKSAIS